MNSPVPFEQAFHRGTAPVFALLTPDQTRRLAELPGDPDLQLQFEALARKANEGTLSDDEREEYQAHIDVNDWLATLQAEARFRLTEIRQG